MKGRFFLWAALGLLFTTAVVSVIYLGDIGRAYDRVAAAGTVVATPFGDIEFTEGGTGTAILVIHGSGGGYDQGELIAKAVLNDRFHWIAPSRFGYLRSELPEAATWDDQTHAYTHLLDHLGIDQVAVIAMSQGGPSALLFAALYPERVSSLTLISCGVASSTSRDQSQANASGDRLKNLFKYDFLYWGTSKLFKTQLMKLIGASEEVIANLTLDERQLFEDFIDYMNPASLRSAGASFDNRATMPGDRIAAISAPTLILHAKDDGLQLYHNAEFAAATIPNARLVSFDSGGHFLIGTERTAIREMVAEHVLGHLTE